MARDRRGVQRRQARYGTLAGVSILVVLGILVAINYIGSKQNKRWDLTTNKQFSLSDQSRNVLAKLDSPMQIRVFAQEPEFQRYRDKLKEYEYASKKVSTEYIDPDKKPTVARQAGIQTYGTIVFDYKGRTERVTSDTEQDLTNTVIKVVSGKQRKVYFTQGHGERDTASSEREGYNAIATALGRENYTVDKVVIAQQGAVPDDASIVVAAGPKIDFFPAEIDALKKYLDKAGKLLLEIDPPDKPDSSPLTNLIALAHDWGFDVGNNVVVDASGMGRLIGTDASVPVVLDISAPRHHRAVPAPDGVPAGAIGDAGHGRRQRPHAAEHRRNRPAQLGGGRHQGVDDHRRGIARRGQGRQERPGRDRRGGVVAAASGRRDPPALGDTPREGRRRESSSSATRISSPTPAWASRATATCS